MAYDIKFPYHNENDTFWDDYHRENGMMTNREFFTSNEKGGFYYGMVYNEETKEWRLNDEFQRREDERLRKEQEEEDDYYSNW